jgi:hypothetical protein
VAKPTEFYAPSSRHNPDDVLCFQRAEANWIAFCKAIDAEDRERKRKAEPVQDDDAKLKQELAELF